MAGAPVNIVYPIEGATYPITDPAPGPLKSAYVAFSFCLTLPGGPAYVSWGVGRAKFGQAKFYDQYSTQQVWKLPGGKHRFWVKANSGGITHNDQVKFRVGA